MTQADAARHEDRHVSRRCDVCGQIVRADCYPRSGKNQLAARTRTSRELALHIRTHAHEELVAYLQRIHQVSE